MKKLLLVLFMLPIISFAQEIPKNFKVLTDEFTKDSLIIHNKAVGNYMYISKDEDGYSLKFSMRYSGNDWIFMDKVHFIINGNVLTFDFLATDRDARSGMVVEDGLLLLDTEDELINGILASNELKYRFEGERIYTSEIKGGRLNVLKETINLYNELSN